MCITQEELDKKCFKLFFYYCPSLHLGGIRFLISERGKNLII